MHISYDKSHNPDYFFLHKGGNRRKQNGDLKEDHGDSKDLSVLLGVLIERLKHFGLTSPLLLFLIPKRQFEQDLRSPVRLALEENFPLVRINHFFSDRHSQACALGLF